MDAVFVDNGSVDNGDPSEDLPHFFARRGGNVMSERALTARQQSILDWLRDEIDRRGMPPTIREIGEEFGIRSTKGVEDHLAALERKGSIRRERG